MSEVGEFSPRTTDFLGPQLSWDVGFPRRISPGTLALLGSQTSWERVSPRSVFLPEE